MRDIWVHATLLLGSILALPAQDCPRSSARQIFHGNDIRTVISNTGNLFQMDNYNLFQVPFDGPVTPNAVYAGGLWMGGYDDHGTLLVAAQTFLNYSNLDYGPGPLSATGTAWTDTCKSWNRIWSVPRNDVLLHIADLADNGQIDDTLATIFSWPGRDNTYFEIFNGFALMNTSNFGAPFADLNANQAYEPHLGEYPHPAGVDPDVIPMTMAWTVFNDNTGPHHASGGIPMHVEVQLTMYAFICDNDHMLNEALFVSYRVVNRSTSAIDSMYVGQWVDPDLGCHLDDYTGSYPEGDTYFAYNADAIDGLNGDTCSTLSGPKRTYGEHPPVLSVTLLNRPMTSSMYTYSATTGEPHPPEAILDPQNGAPREFYRLLSARWPDGTRLTTSGTGYDVQSTAFTPFAFTGDPNDTTSWAMVNTDSIAGDIRMIGATAIPTLGVGQAAMLDLAFVFHRDTTKSHTGNVSMMYDRVNRLRELYDAGFLSGCTTVDIPCKGDCVYPGDTDQDGKVTLKDYLNSAVGLQTTGPGRTGPIAFLPLPAETWDHVTMDGVNYKHLDSDGNGTIEIDDIYITDLHYDNIAPWHVPPEDLPYGDDIRIYLENAQIEIGEPYFDVEVYFANPDVDSLYGLFFAFEYDPAMFAIATGSGISLLGQDDALHKTRSKPGRFEYVVVGTDLKNKPVEPAPIMQLSFFGNEDITLPGGIDSTFLRITDVKAVLSDGTIVDLRGQRVPLYIVEESSATAEADARTAGFQIYPNPSNGRVHLDNEGIPKDTPVTFFFMDGLVADHRDHIGDRLQVDLSPGIYYVVLKSTPVQTAKVVVVR